MRMWKEVVNTIAANMPPGAGTYIVSITREHYKNMSSRQRNIIRILLISEQDLRLFLNNDKEINLESDKHCTRLDTLKSLAKIWFKLNGVDPETKQMIARPVEASW